MLTEYVITGKATELCKEMHCASQPHLPEGRLPVTGLRHQQGDACGHSHHGAQQRPDAQVRLHAARPAGEQQEKYRKTIKTQVRQLHTCNCSQLACVDKPVRTMPNKHSGNDMRKGRTNRARYGTQQQCKKQPGQAWRLQPISMNKLTGFECSCSCV